VSFQLLFLPKAKETLFLLEKTDPKKHKKVVKTLGILSINPRNQSLNTHKFSGVSGFNNEEIFEAYVQNKTPSAYRIFCFYGPEKKNITIVAITPHP